MRPQDSVDRNPPWNVAYNVEHRAECDHTTQRPESVSRDERERD